MNEQASGSREDEDRVNIQKNYEVRNWARTFGCSEEALREAVKAVGTWPDSVRRYLAQR